MNEAFGEDLCRGQDPLIYRGSVVGAVGSREPGTQLAATDKASAFD